MELPVPKHLIEIFELAGSDNSEYSASGNLQCKCGSRDFQIHMVGDDSQYKKLHVIKVQELDGKFYLIIKAKCTNCSSIHLVFDNDFHGWNGYVCGGDSREMARPETKLWNCPKCGSEKHGMLLHIESQGKNDFLSEGGEEFGEENWIEAFSWITIETECSECKEHNKGWISYETM